MNVFKVIIWNENSSLFNRFLHRRIKLTNFKLSSLALHKAHNCKTFSVVQYLHGSFIFSEVEEC